LTDQARPQQRLNFFPEPQGHGSLRPIIDDAIGLQSLQTAVDVAEKGVVVDHRRAEDGVDLRLVREESWA
jgi:hypothetical protein